MMIKIIVPNTAIKGKTCFCLIFKQIHLVLCCLKLISSGYVLVKGTFSYFWKKVKICQTQAILRVIFFCSVMFFQLMHYFSYIFLSAEGLAQNCCIPNEHLAYCKHISSEYAAIFIYQNRDRDAPSLFVKFSVLCTCD